jgi:hypothetical protein
MSQKVGITMAETIQYDMNATLFCGRTAASLSRHSPGRITNIFRAVHYGFRKVNHLRRSGKRHEAHINIKARPPL